MSNINGFKKAKIRKSKSEQLARQIIASNRARYWCSERVQQYALTIDSVINWDFLVEIGSEFTIDAVHYKPTENSINSLCNRIEAQRLLFEPTVVSLRDTATPFYKDDQDYLIIEGKKITLNELKNRLLGTILEGK